jgi:hypothetical protein
MERKTPRGWVLINPPKENGWGEYADAESELEQLAQSHDEWPEPTIANFWQFGRFYEIYAFLAGVRSSYSPMFKAPRGIPVDVHPLLRAAYDDWGPDAHSATWYTLSELEHHFRARGMDKRKNGFTTDGIERLRNLILAMNREAEKYKLTNQDIRMIIWFDN